MLTTLYLGESKLSFAITADVCTGIVIKMVFKIRKKLLNQILRIEKSNRISSSRLKSN